MPPIISAITNHLPLVLRTRTLLERAIACGKFVGEAASMPHATIYSRGAR